MIKFILFICFTAYSVAGIGNIMAFKGKATIEQSDNTILVVSSGMEINQGDTIITEDKTRVQVILKDETIITIGANSTFKFSATPAPLREKNTYNLAEAQSSQRYCG